ncbi:sigma-70 family RNA polymerase sigma factor [Enterococcus timonensis]|uniref:sigma-70 family RNA polymerase sigma factor n=1 Tax=Enterococcus timonensis TaxID=1852364 RepID=UPI0008D91F9E|nr:sigma-70 family RNA polymerase sigma factor [Enterococcus timonensis]
MSETSSTVDQQIIDLLNQRDFVGLELLIKTYKQAIHQEILQHLPSFLHSQLPDLENEVYFKIWEKSQLYDPQKSLLKTWLTAVAKHTTLDFLRQEKNHKKEISLEKWQEDFAIQDPALAQEFFMAHLQSLKSLDQTIFLRYYFYEETAEEIGADLKLSPAKIYNHLSRGRKKLARVLGKEQFHA